MFTSLDELTVGMKVRARINLIEDACGEHPALLYASEGDELIIREINPDYTSFKIQISHEDVTDRSFGCTLSEIEAI